MSLFSDFPEMRTGNNTPQHRSRAHKDLPASTAAMHCSGCGSKVSGKVLTRALERVRAEAPSHADWPHRHNIYAGLDAPDDAAIIQAPNGKLAVHTVDHFSALIHDPFVFGQVCANHCLSDLFAMGATSHNVLAIATIPYGTEAAQEETLYQLLLGATIVLADAKTFLVGGHTTEGTEMSLGFACNGWIDPEQIWSKSGMQLGQSLILTKALGTGTLFAADQQRQAKGRWIEAAVASMLTSNREAAECFKQHGATACTDVTGFGLAGHLLEMVEASKVDVALDLSAIAHLPGADTTLSQAFFSSLHQRNRTSAITSIQLERTPTHLPTFQILFDPQTSGGLLASIPTSEVDACLSDLHEMCYLHSRCIVTVQSANQRAMGIT